MTKKPISANYYRHARDQIERIVEAWKDGTIKANSPLIVDIVTSWGPEIIAELSSQTGFDCADKDKLIDFVNSIERDVHGIDVFKGAGNYTKAMEEVGAVVLGYDILDGPQCDITTAKGKANIFLMVLRVVVLGVVGGGPECRLMIWLSSRNHRRNNRNPLGNVKNQLVRGSNDIAKTWRDLCKIVELRGALTWTENPRSTWFFKMPWWKEMMKNFKAMPKTGWIEKLHMWQIRYGHPGPKPTYVEGTFSGLLALDTKKRPHAEPGHSVEYKKTWEQIGGKVNGDHAQLKTSGIYPITLCRALAEGFLDLWYMSPPCVTEQLCFNLDKADHSRLTKDYLSPLRDPNSTWPPCVSVNFKNHAVSQESLDSSPQFPEENKLMSPTQYQAQKHLTRSDGNPLLVPSAAVRTAGGLLGARTAD